MKTMLDLRKISALSLAAGLACASFAPAATAAEGCETYGKLALQQQKQNESAKCGFSGAEWSSDLKAHIAWCNGVAPQEWQQMLKKRADMLSGCGK